MFLVKFFFTEPEIINDIEYHIEVNDSVGTDHPNGFYNPKDLRDAQKANCNPECNDTVICSGNSPYNKIEKLTIDLENFINSKDFKLLYPRTGFDVKVLSVQIINSINITICIPFIASKTPDYATYNFELNKIRILLMERIRKVYPVENVILDINTKDKGKYAYLTVFGTALDKGDYGAVGRGNRRNGLIHSNRSMSLEAVSGKNPVNHSGKLYNEVAQKLSNYIFQKFGVTNTVHIVAKNGELLSNPSLVFIETNISLSNNNKTKIECETKRLLDSIEKITNELISRDTVGFHKNSDIIFQSI